MPFRDDRLFTDVYSILYYKVYVLKLLLTNQQDDNLSHVKSPHCGPSQGFPICLERLSHRDRYDLEGWFPGDAEGKGKCRT